MSRDFLLLVFFINQFPPSPEYPIMTVSNFFDNSRRYSQLKVDHRCRWHCWQMEKIFNQINNFLGHLRIVELTYIYIFAFKFTLRYLQPDVNPIVCHRCRWHRRQICRWYRWHRWQQHYWNWWQNLPPVSLTPLANLPPVSLILVLNLELRISLRIFEKNLKWP